MSLLRWTAIVIVQCYRVFAGFNWAKFSMINMVLIMCGFSKMAQQPIHLVVPFHFSEKYIQDMLYPCVVISGGRRVRQIWPSAIFFVCEYLKAKVYEQRPVTLEALKDAIWQEVAAITPEMTPKIKDKYRQRLNKLITIQERHLSDILFKTAFSVLYRNRNIFAVSSMDLKLFTS